MAGRESRKGSEYQEVKIIMGHLEVVYLTFIAKSLEIIFLICYSVSLPAIHSSVHSNFSSLYHSIPIKFLLQCEGLRGLLIVKFK